MITIGRKVTVGTVPALMLRIRANSVQFLNVRAAGALSLVTEGGTVDNGMPLNDGEVSSFERKDFEGLPDTEWFDLYAVAPAAASLYIYGMLRE